jgi:hypothetical protein
VPMLPFPAFVDPSSQTEGHSKHGTDLEIQHGAREAFPRAVIRRPPRWR